MFLNKKLFVFCSNYRHLLCPGVYRTENTAEGQKMIENRYRARVRIETSNPLWHILFALAFSKDFTFFEKRDESGNFREVAVTNRGEEIVKIFSLNGVCSGKVDLGGEYWADELDHAQAQTFFKVQDFMNAAAPGSSYSGDYKGKNSLYPFYVNAIKEEGIMIKEKWVQALYFEAFLLRRGEKHLEAQLWFVKNGEMSGRIIKGVFKKKNLPKIILEINGN